MTTGFPRSCARLNPVVAMINDAGSLLLLVVGLSPRLININHGSLMIVIDFYDQRCLSIWWLQLGKAVDPQSFLCEVIPQDGDK